MHMLNDPACSKEIYMIMEYYSSLSKRGRREDTSADAVCSSAVPEIPPQEDTISSDDEELLEQSIYNSSRTAQLRSIISFPPPQLCNGGRALQY